MRILILSREVPPDLGIGGIGSYTGTIAPALAARGHDVHVLACAPGQQVSDVLIDGAWIHRRDVFRFRGAERLIGISPEAGRRLQLAASCFAESRKLGIDFDVIESPEWMAEGLILGIRRRHPIVVHLHTPTAVLARYAGRPVGGDLRRSDRLERTLVRLASVSTSPSRLLDRHLRQVGWMKKPAKIIPYPMDADGWENKEDEHRRTDPVVLFVGRLEYRKAPEILVEAIVRLRERVSSVQAIFIGQSSGTRGPVPYGEWTVKMAEAASAPCRFIGWVSREQLPHWYRRARVVAVPSRFESYSMTALEAMAAGRPVVYSSEVGAGEVIARSGGGAEVAPEDPIGLAEALLPFLADEEFARSAGRIAGQAVRTTCAPAAIAAARESCYEDAVSSFKRGRDL